MSWLRLGRAGVLTGDILIGVAFLSVGLALLAPTLRARSFRARVDATVDEVEALCVAAERLVEQSGTWPAAEATGILPPQLLGALPGEVDLVRDGYTLQWARWEVVDSAEAPPPTTPPPLDAVPDTVGPSMIPFVREVGGVVLYSSDDALLAELLARFGSSVSFVRDTTWTLVLPRRAGGS